MHLMAFLLYFIFSGAISGADLLFLRADFNLTFVYPFVVIGIKSKGMRF